MRCIHYHCPQFPIISQLKYKQQLNRANLLWLSTTEPTGVLQNKKCSILAASVRTKAIISSSMILGVTSPATTGDLTILLPVSAGLFFVYWIANFVVPDIVYKDLQSDNKSEDQRLNDHEDNKSPMKDEEENTSMSNPSQLGGKKRGFYSAKR